MARTSRASKASKAKSSKAARSKESKSSALLPDGAKVASIDLSTMKEGSLARARFAKVRTPCTVEAALAHVSRFDLRCAVERGRVKITK